MKFEDVNSKESQGESQGYNGSNQSPQSGSSDGFNVSNIEIKERNGVTYEKRVTETRELGDGQVTEQTVISEILIPQANGEFVGRSDLVYCTTHRKLHGELYVMSPDRSVWCYVCGEPTCISHGVLLSRGKVICTRHAAGVLGQLKAEQRHSLWEALKDLISSVFSQAPMSKQPALQSQPRKASRSNTKDKKANGKE